MVFFADSVSNKWTYINSYLLHKYFKILVSRSSGNDLQESKDYLSDTYQGYSRQTKAELGRVKPMPSDTEVTAGEQSCAGDSILYLLSSLALYEIIDWVN